MQVNAEHTGHLAIWRSTKVNARASPELADLLARGFWNNFVRSNHRPTTSYDLVRH